MTGFVVYYYESVWMIGEFANKLATFSSIHFGYASCTGAVMIADSDVLSCLFSSVGKYALRG